MNIYQWRYVVLVTVVLLSIWFGVAIWQLNTVRNSNYGVLMVREVLCMDGYTVKYADINCTCLGWVANYNNPDEHYIVIGSGTELYSFEFYRRFYHEKCHIGLWPRYSNGTIVYKVLEELWCDIYGAVNAAFNKAEFC